MGKGRKIISLTNSDWEKVFYDSVGTYVQYINQYLGKHFEKEPLYNHITIVGGYSFKSSEYKKSGIPVIRISDFSNEEINLESVVYYESSEDFTRFELKEGDIIIALTGGTIAKLAIVQSSLGKLYLNQRVGKFQVMNPEEFENEYIYWIARSVQSEIKKMAWGAAIPNVSPKQIEELKFPIPTKNIQRSIITFLNDLKQNKVDVKNAYFNDAIERNIYSLQQRQFCGSILLNEQTLQLNFVFQLRQSFLRDAMQGKLVPQEPNDEPASELLKKIKAEKEKLIAEGKIKKQKPLPKIKPEEIPYEIPENWVWCRLDEISSKIGSGSTPRGSNYSKSGIPFFRSQNIYDNGLVYDDIKFISAEVHQSMEGTTVFANDILLNITGGSLGRCAFVDGMFVEGNVSQHVCIIRPILMLNKFLHNVILSPYFQELIFSSTTGAGREGLPKYNLEQFFIPLPPLAEQPRIVSKLEQLMQLCDQLEKNINQSNGQTNLLLLTLLREALDY